ncbi:SRPBCC family protein [Pseudonocardia sp. N23]|uniref:SRPBCC family protein n=1 Tax=Pseudonocardia sp. N23 TaxID=1987376 RepID=UPI000BFCFDE4|nr:SRPBCC family protein [Pseudonocardia sp. N23]GAY10948.1 hypothetical protein TOK_5433 [Pseudonocardia sp. N23]
MVVDVTTEAVLDHPRVLVAAFAGDPANAPRWYANIDGVEWLTSPPLVVGSRLAFRARFLGRILEYVYEVVEYEPGRRLAMRTEQGPFPMETTYTWDDAGEGRTLMTLHNSGEPSGFAAVTAPAMAAAIRRANRRDLARLARELAPRKS